MTNRKSNAYPLPEDSKALYLKTEIDPFVPSGTKFTIPRCPAFSTCGGCQLQHIPVELQGETKRQRLISILESAQVDLTVPVEKTRTMVDNAFNYRNKADFTARTWDNQIHLGFTPHGGRGNLVEVNDCPILMPVINDTLSSVRSVVADNEALTRKLVSITVRASHRDNKSYILYHSKYKDETVYSNITAEIQNKNGNVSGGTFVKKRKEYTLGESLIGETIGSIDLQYTVRTFFQANIPMTEKLCNVVEELAEQSGRSDGVLLDIYCGVGLFALRLADKFSQVYGIEATPASVDMAIINSRRNGHSDIPFYRDMAEERLQQLLMTGIYPDVIILDPPRSGLHRNVIGALTGLKPSPCLILVSCNPVSLADNIKDLQKGGYILNKLIPVDMFPQTEHLEVVASMSRQD